jgi:hypothetical protein
MSRSGQSPIGLREAIPSIVTNGGQLGKKEHIKKEGFGVRRGPLCVNQISPVLYVWS